jgi:ribosome-associated translation inhibitor RaiA
VPVGVVVVQATDVDIHAAVDRAADCLGRSFRRHLQRRRALRTGRESVRLEQDLRWLRA